MKLIVSILIALSVVASLIFYVSHKRISKQPASRVSPITFEAIDKIVKSDPSDGSVQECSRRFEGTRVRWNGTITGIENRQTVYVAMNVYPADVQFNVSRNIASGLKKGQSVRFVGTVEKITDAETFPPMLHTYVVLQDVELQSSAP